jgi:hypothetical protein
MARLVSFRARDFEPIGLNRVIHRMPRISWSLAAALSMSALAVFRPEIGSKSLAAHAARSLTRVVESIAQRFQSGSLRVASASDARSSNRVDLALVDGQAASSVARSGDAAPPDRAETMRARGGFSTSTLASANASSDVGVARAALAPTNHSSPPAVHFAPPQGVESASMLAREHGRAAVPQQTAERHWKDCAVAAICSGIPGPSMLRSTPSALGKPPSV